MSNKQDPTPCSTRRPPTINQQLFGALFFVCLLAVVLFTVVSYFSRRKSLTAEIDARLYAVATMAGETLPADYHDRITGPESVSAAEFRRIVDRNNRLCVELGLEYIWSLMRVDGRIVFTTSSSPDKIVDNGKHADFFEPHSNPELYTNALATLRTTYTCSHDKWGNIRAVLVPAVDCKGRAYLFGASVRMDEVDRKLATIFWRALGLGSILFAVSLSVAFWVSRAVTRPLRRLADTVKQIAEGKTHLATEESGTFEQRTLARHFNQMNRALHGKIAELETARVRLIGQHDDEIKQVEDSRKMSEQRYRGLLNFAVDGILIGTQDGTIIEANVRICELFGLRRDEVLGKNIREMPFTLESMQHRPFMFDLLNRGQMVVSERTIRRRDGTEVVIEMHTKMMPDRTYQSIYHDITNRKAIEDSLKETRRMLEESQRIAKLGAWKYDVLTQKLVWTDEVYRIHGVPLDFDLSQLEAVFSFYPPEDRSVIKRAFARALELGEPYDLDLNFIRADGEHRSTRASARPVFEKGKVIRVDGNFMDITERKLAEAEIRRGQEQLARQYEMLDALMQNLTVGVFMVEAPSGKPLVANQAARELLGRGILPNADAGTLGEVYEAYRLSDRSMRYPVSEMPITLGMKGISAHVDDLVVVQPGGSERILEIFGSPVKDVQGHVWASLVSFADITERRKAQELLESWNASLERRVAERTAEVEKYTRQLQALTGRLVRVEEDERQRITDVLHEDVQQTLVAARMTLGVALGSVRGAALQGALSSVDSMLTRAIQLTRSLVQEIAVPSVREGDVPSAIRWLAQHVQDKFGITVRVNEEGEVSPVSENVYLCLYRAVQELLFNVAKHAGVREAEVKICQAVDGILHVAVIDHGCGFSHKVLLESESGNDGFGLFSIRERIEGLGGHMEVVSAAGKGTTVILTVYSRTTAPC